MQQQRRPSEEAQDQNRRRSFSDSAPVTSTRRSRIRNPFRNGSRHERSTGNTDEDFKEDVHSDNDRTESSSQVATAPLQTISQHTRRGSNPTVERFAVKPVYAYPKIKMTREELRKEMNRTSSYFHDYTKGSSSKDSKKRVGAIHLEVLQCFGLPRRDVRKNGSACCIMVCDSYAFKTDIMPPVLNPKLLSKHRRACIFPLYQAYSRVYIGVFAKAEKSAMDRFIGRIVLDLSRLRPGSTYDVTLPLRSSNQVYSRAKRGAIRCRVHLRWENERAALLSYLPIGKPQFRPHDKVTVRCSDNKAFQNVARTVHGQDVPGKFSMRLTKATAREVNFTRIHVFRYLWKREFRAIMQWRYPIISLFVFVAWMHSVYAASLSYVPGNVVTLLLLYLWKNYTVYVLDPHYDKGFPMPYMEEMIGTLLFGRGIEPLQMDRKDALKNSELSEGAPDPQSSNLQELARVFQDSVPRIKRARISADAFFGREAVSFLVDMNYASSRQEAVDLGKRLQHETGLFHHVRKRQIDFRDSDVVFVFSNIETSAYVYSTHNPWFCALSRFLFSSGGNMRSDVHMEFPFASSQDHPRFTVRDGLDSKEPMNLLEHMLDPNSDVELDEVESSDDENDDEIGSISSDADFDENAIHPKIAVVESFSSSFVDILKVASADSTLQQTLLVESSTPPLSPSQSFDDYYLEDDLVHLEVSNSQLKIASEGTEILLLSKPPSQDIDVVQKKDETLSQLLHKTSMEVHSKFGNLFHDKAYRIRPETTTKNFDSEVVGQPITGPSKSQLVRRTTQVIASSMPQTSYASEKQELAQADASIALKAKKDTCDKLLRSGKYSSGNVIMGKVALVVQPLVEIAQTFLASFRACHNIMTWRDPFLSFWVVIFGISLIPILHLFPWRLFLGVVGVLLVGPQNFAIRAIKEYFQGPTEDNLDALIRKKRTDVDEETVSEAPIFSNNAIDNRPITQDFSTLPQDIKEVAVPQSQFLYRRCYDWPPEPEYARVTVTSAPKSNAEAERLLEANLLETYMPDTLDGCSDHKLNNLSSSNGGKRWARIVNRSVASVKHVPTRLRSGRKKDV
ncbi:glutamate-cysteine ligase [Nitzschia inconspicua]|uniref:Glutamate-cysteine ligase n=1 Tax=Nitzschia inconspicua TaxID=303405 RepID=A0A9K3LS73_9STRA|nr:glutamate-cysteine ligase [Nitzschia inconspicua]